MITVTTDICCDYCEECECGGTTHKVQIREMRKEAHRWGWMTLKRKGRLVDLCPDCAKEYKEGKLDETG